jgi:hypothetical protein
MEITAVVLRTQFYPMFCDRNPRRAFPQSLAAPSIYRVQLEVLPLVTAVYYTGVEAVSGFCKPVPME